MGVKNAGIRRCRGVCGWTIRCFWLMDAFIKKIGTETTKRYIIRFTSISDDDEATNGNSPLANENNRAVGCSCAVARSISR